MVNYNNGKIYKIESLIGGCVYYGSTTKKHLSIRLSAHRYDMRNNIYCSSSIVLQYPDAKIILVEDCKCNNKYELTMREGYYIRNYDCVNKCIPHRTNKEYYEDNKECILKQQTKYRNNNKDKINNYLESKVICECGSICSRRNISAHKKSDYHKNKINNPFYYTKL